MNRPPALQFYPADWRKDPGVQAMTYHDRGVWFEILCLMHESEQRGKLLLNGKKMPEDALARLLGLDKQILTKTLTTILDFGVASLDEKTGALTNRRMIHDERIRKIRKAAGSLGGNPNLLNQKPTTQVNQMSTPSSSSSSSLNKKKKKEREKTHPPHEKLRYGEFKNVALTETQYQDLEKRLGSHERDRWVTELDLAIGRGHKCKDAYMTILTWRRNDIKNNPQSEMTKEEVQKMVNEAHS